MSVAVTVATAGWLFNGKVGTRFPGDNITLHNTSSQPAQAWKNVFGKAIPVTRKRPFLLSTGPNRS